MGRAYFYLAPHRISFIILSAYSPVGYLVRILGVTLFGLLGEGLHTVGAISLPDDITKPNNMQMRSISSLSNSIVPAGSRGNKSSTKMPCQMRNDLRGTNATNCVTVAQFGGSQRGPNGWVLRRAIIMPPIMVRRCENSEFCGFYGNNNVFITRVQSPFIIVSINATWGQAGANALLVAHIASCVFGRYRTVTQTEILPRIL